MIGRASLDEVRSWVATAARAAETKGGTDTLVLDVGPLLSVTDAFMITSGSNTRQVRTMVEEIEERVKVVGGPGPLRVEGLDDATWVLMDYGDFIVHVFGAETRAFYDLDGLWADADHWEWQLAASAGVD
jgi:ribosome-associated protein